MRSTCVVHAGQDGQVACATLSSCMECTHHHPYRWQAWHAATEGRMHACPPKALHGQSLVDSNTRGLLHAPFCPAPGPFASGPLTPTAGRAHPSSSASAAITGMEVQTTVKHTQHARRSPHSLHTHSAAEVLQADWDMHLHHAECMQMSAPLRLNANPAVA